MAVSTQISFITLFFFGFLLSGLYTETLIITTNKCSYTIWPGMLSSWPLPTTGFALQPGDSNTVPVPDAWSGQLWGRTLCSHNITGNFSCITGDCGTSTIECGGRNAATPVTLVEFTLNGTDGLDYFDVSLVDGFNLPVRVEPRSRTGAENCRATSCGKDLNQKCPVELKVTKDGEGVVACKSACQAEACNSTLFSQFFKSECPHAHVYAYDHGSFTCASADYIITFCPTSSKSSIRPENQKKNPAAVDNSGGHVNIFIVIPMAAAVSLIIGCICYFACNISYRSSNRECQCGINFRRTSRAEAVARNPLHSFLTHVWSRFMN